MIKLDKLSNIFNNNEINKIIKDDPYNFQNTLAKYITDLFKDKYFYLKSNDLNIFYENSTFLERFINSEHYRTYRKTCVDGESIFILNFTDNSTLFFKLYFDEKIMLTSVRTIHFQI